MSVSPYLLIHSALLARKRNKTLFIPIKLSGKTEIGSVTVEDEGMIDCGAGGEFINQNFAHQKGLPLTRLLEPLDVHNVDGTLNKTGTINYTTTLDVTIDHKTKPITFYITGLG